MNDYTVGALEALSYAMAIIDKHFPVKKEGPEVDVYTELEATVLKLVAGCGLVFKDKVDLIRTGLPK